MGSRPRLLIMVVEKNIKNNISHENPIVKQTTKRLSKHKLSTELSLFTSYTNKLQSQVAITFEKHKLAEECIKVLQIEHINYRPVTGGRCIEAKARPLRGQSSIYHQGHDFGSSSSRTVLEVEDPIPGSDEPAQTVFYNTTLSQYVGDVIRG